MLSLQYTGVPSYKKPSLIAQEWIISLPTPATDHSLPSHASLWHSSRPLSPSVPCSASQPGYVLLKARLGLVPSLVPQHPTYCRCSLDICWMNEWMNDCEFLPDFDAQETLAAPQSLRREVLSLWLRISDWEITGEQCRLLYMCVCADNHWHLLLTIGGHC